MKEMITLCGDDCLKCPRYNAKTPESLRHTAEIWYKIGWRDTIVSDEEIKCTGCHPDKNCSYGLTDCAKSHKVKKCNQCKSFPCDKIDRMLYRSAIYEECCKTVCSADDYATLKSAFFNKAANLRNK